MIFSKTSGFSNPFSLSLISHSFLLAFSLQCTKMLKSFLFQDNSCPLPSDPPSHHPPPSVKVDHAHCLTCSPSVLSQAGQSRLCCPTLLKLPSQDLPYLVACSQSQSRLTFLQYLMLLTTLLLTFTFSVIVVCPSFSLTTYPQFFSQEFWLSKNQYIYLFIYLLFLI